jgi:predicted nucleic acid-binding protein
VIVLDASALVELALSTALGRRVAARIGDPETSLHVPHLADVEVGQALRRYVRLGEIDASTGAAALDTLAELDLERHGHGPFMRRVWALRNNFSAYDAVYLALAEALGAPLVTCDGRLARAPGTSVRVEVIAAEAAPPRDAFT